MSPVIIFVHLNGHEALEVCGSKKCNNINAFENKCICKSEKTTAGDELFYFITRCCWFICWNACDKYLHNVHVTRLLVVNWYRVFSMAVLRLLGISSVRFRCSNDIDRPLLKHSVSAQISVEKDCGESKNGNLYHVDYFVCVMGTSNRILLCYWRQCRKRIAGKICLWRKGRQKCVCHGSCFRVRIRDSSDSNYYSGNAYISAVTKYETA